MANFVFLNDKLIEKDKAMVNAADTGILYGAGLFETMRSYGGKVFRIDDHIQRLLNSCNTLGVHKFEKDFLTQAVEKTLLANELKDARIRLTITNGSLDADEQLKPTLIVTATRLTGYPEEYYKNGILTVLSPYRQNSMNPVEGHKSTSYFPKILALNNATSRKAAEAIWFTVDGRLAEGCISNVFIVMDSKIYTPSLETPVLDGVMRKTVIEIAAENNIECSEKDIFIKDLLEADEVFITNVIMQIMPVVQIEKHTIRKGKVGNITWQLRELFADMVFEKYPQS